MTTNEIYNLGWVCGRICQAAEAKAKPISEKYIQDASNHPLAGLSTLIKLANDRRLMQDKKLEQEIANALNIIEIPNDTTDFLIPSQSGTWQLGYYSGISNGPFKTTHERNLANLRKKAKLSQQQLADLIGVDQAKISRWENDVETITEEMKNKIIRACEEITDNLKTKQ